MMEKVNGMGGVFFKAREPEALAEWYETHLGIRQTPSSYDVEPWSQEAGETVFAPFPADTDYFGDSNLQWMINFRVDDMDAIVGQLTNAGIEVEVAPKAYPNGRFAHLNDPEGNRIELWEPAGPDSNSQEGR